jgi:hypothetical protein
MHEPKVNGIKPDLSLTIYSLLLLLLFVHNESNDNLLATCNPACPDDASHNPNIFVRAGNGIVAAYWESSLS